MQTTKLLISASGLSYLGASYLLQKYEENEAKKSETVRQKIDLANKAATDGVTAYFAATDAYNHHKELLDELRNSLATANDPTLKNEIASHEISLAEDRANQGKAFHAAIEANAKAAGMKEAQAEFTKEHSGLTKKFIRGFYKLGTEIFSEDFVTHESRGLMDALRPKR